MAQTDQLPILRAFDRALSRETDNLLRLPELTWQQLYNDLQWEPMVEDVVGPQLERRSASGATPWVRTRARRGSTSLLQVLRGHAGRVSGCAISHDGSFIVSAGGHDKTVRIWDSSTGAERATFVGHQSGVCACAVSPDGSFVVSAGGDQVLKVWDLWNGTERHTLRGHERGAYGLIDCAVAPDGSVVSAGGDGTVRIWDPRTGEEKATLPGGGGRIDGCAVSPNGSFLVSTEEASPTVGEPAIRVWDLSRRKLLGIRKRKELAKLEGRRANDCDFSPDGSVIVSADDDGPIGIWDPRTGEQRATLTSHESGAYACAVSPDGSFIASAGFDATVRIWDLQTGEERATLLGNMGPVWDVAISPDGSFVVSAGEDGTLRIWDPAGDESGVASTHDAYLMGLAFSPDGSFVASRGTGGFRGKQSLAISETSTGLKRFKLTEGGPRIDSIVVSPDASYVASCGSNGTLRIWDPQTGEERATLGLEGHDRISSAEVAGCAFSPDGSLIVARVTPSGLFGYDRPEERDPVTWDARTGQKRSALRGHGGIVNACAVSPDGSRIVSASNDHTVKVWDAGTGREVTTLSGHIDWVRDCAISPDGSQVVSAGGDGTVRIWDLTSGEEQATLRGHDDAVRACAFSPDGSFVVSMSNDGIIRVWDASNGKSWTTNRGEVIHDYTEISSFAILPTGSLIASASSEHKRDLRIWKPLTGEAVATIPLAADVCSFSAHPWLPLVAAGDSLGNLHLLEIVALEPEPIIVTAADRGDGPMLRCPGCFREHAGNADWPGQVITCPTETCELQLRVNPFVVRKPRTLPERDGAERMRSAEAPPTGG